MRYYAGDGLVSGVSLELRGAAETLSLVGSGTGAYAFAAVPAGTWRLTPSKQGDLRGAVTALDAARVLQAVSGTMHLNALQALACDVTGDGTVSTLDASLILQLSTATISSLPAAGACQSDWLFVPEPLALDGQSVTQPTLTAGLCEPGAIAYAPLQGDATGQDFAALVLGDCTGNWEGATAGSALQRRRDLPRVRLAPARQAGARRWKVAILVSGLGAAQAFEARLAIDPDQTRVRAVQLPGARGALAGIGDADEGRVRIAAAAPVARRLDRRPLAVLVIDNLVDEAPPDIRLLAARIDEHPVDVAR